MRLFFCLMVGFLSFSGCKKKIESIKEDLLIKLIVDGQWAVNKYTKGATDETYQFSAYSFQFKKDFTVDAIRNGAVDNTGTWSGDVNTRIITSNFTNANPTLMLLNGNWYVTDSGMDYVETTQTINNEACFLRLLKK